MRLFALIPIGKEEYYGYFSHLYNNKKIFKSREEAEQALDPDYEEIWEFEI